MSQKRIHGTINSILDDVLKKEFRDDFLIPSYMVHERIMEIMKSRGILGMKTEKFIESSIRRQKRERLGTYFVEILDWGDETLYVNMKHRLSKIFLELPRYVRANPNSYLPTGIGSVESLQDENAVDIDRAIENIRTAYSSKKIESLLSESVVKDMMEKWNTYCDNGILPFKKTENGRWYVDPNSEIIPGNLK